ncbi:TDG/mug DNA glycosylase family protein [Kutzneria buriramensis]|uniref:TDG/mug DNA glycosylase family protein n=1 Tax=Kutzneria buriramensis TaxID=1045776 RepID=A0A3E0I6Z3_9PSEU|nr:TDG/mug DNA glycosylase family protein [Kutzneria buriramensis]
MPTKAELAAAHGRLLPDVIAEDLDVLFCGINPGLWSAATGHHFARPGNRFWPALWRSGFTPRLFDPSEQESLPGLGLGITNVVARATARADELTDEELVDGGRRLRSSVLRWRPRFLAVVGLGAFRVAFGKPRAGVGLSAETVGETQVWVLPNPSGLNAHWQLPELAEEFGRLRKAALRPG